MATQNKNKNPWSVTGRRYHRGKITINGKIGLPASDPCIPNLKTSSGLPINKEMALVYIRTFNDFVNIKRFALPHPPPEPTEKVQELKMQLKNENSGHAQTKAKLSSLISMAHGMTFDRDLVLKILSQSGCEGLRLYFCAKPSEGNPEKLLISLVVGGVKNDGCDHHVDNSPEIISCLQNMTGTDIDPAITDDSLLGEYSTQDPPQPGKTGPKLKFDKAPDIYALYAQADSLSEAYINKYYDSVRIPHRVPHDLSSLSCL